MPREVDKFFVGQPLDLRRGLDPPWPLGPLGYFGLPMMNPCKPPLPQNKPYHRPLNYPKYMEDFDPNAHVRVFKATIKANGETKDVDIVKFYP